MRGDLFQLHADIETRHWWFVGRRRLVRRVIDAALEPTEMGNLVDFGCGTGANLAEFSNWRSRTGIDASADAVEAARESYPELRIEQGLAPESMPELLNPADLVLIMDVLEHVPDDFELFSSLAGTMKPGSHMLITVPADPRLWSPHDQSFGHYRRYVARDLARLWEGLPFETRLVSYFNSRLYPLIRGVRAVDGLTGSTPGAEETDFFMPPGFANTALTSLFAGESSRLIGELENPSPERNLAYGRGVSLIALLRRGEGEIATRSRPADAAPDLWDPEAG